MRVEKLAARGGFFTGGGRHVFRRIRFNHLKIFRTKKMHNAHHLALKTCVRRRHTMQYRSWYLKLYSVVAP